MKLVALLGLLCAACGGSDNNTPPDGATTAVDAPPACTPADVTTTVPITTVSTGTSTSFAVWTPVAAAGPHAMIARQNDGSGSISVGLIDDTTTTVTPLATLAEAANYAFSASALPGSRCAVVSSSKTGLSLACPGQALDTAASVRDISGDPVFPVQTASSLVVYTQTFASFTEIEHAGAGAWQEHEQFESSISFPTDAVLAGGAPLACFISSGRRAVVIGPSGRASSTATAQWCKLVVDGDTVHVLTDIGYGTVSLAGLQGESGTLALSPVAVASRPDRLVMLGATPHAIVATNDGFSFVPLPTGTPFVLGKATGSNAKATWDPTTHALSVVSYEVDTTGAGPTYPQTVHFQTWCAP